MRRAGLGWLLHASTAEPLPQRQIRQGVRDAVEAQVQVWHVCVLTSTEDGAACPALAGMPCAKKSVEVPSGGACPLCNAALSKG